MFMRLNSAEEIISLHTDNHTSNDHNQSYIPMNSDNSLTVIVVNCQSVQAKKCSLVSLANQYTADIIVGTESWLIPAVNYSEELCVNELVCFKTNHFDQHLVCWRS